MSVPKAFTVAINLKIAIFLDLRLPSFHPKSNFHQYQLKPLAEKDKRFIVNWSYELDVISDCAGDGDGDGDSVGSSLRSINGCSLLLID
jgi:hypothetical protein